MPVFAVTFPAQVGTTVEIACTVTFGSCVSSGKRMFSVLDPDLAYAMEGACHLAQRMRHIAWTRWWDQGDPALLIDSSADVQFSRGQLTAVHDAAQNFTDAVGSLLSSDRSQE